MTESTEAPHEESDKPTEWLHTAVRYAGIGRAEFREPHGFVEGPAWVEFSEIGVARGALTVERFAADEPLPMGLFQLFSGDRPTPGDEPGSIKLAFGLDSASNDCVSLAIKTDRGLFVAEGPMGYSHTLSWSIDAPEGTTLTFQLFNGVYRENPAQAAYWAMPLSNFIARFKQSTTEGFKHHPLRLKKYPTISPDMPVQERGFAELKASSLNRLIEFEYKGYGGFIEPLPDYADREVRLTTGQSLQSMTALMVSTLPEAITTQAQVNQYLPSDITSILSLATGTEVDSQWIELRDASGRLVGRVHRPSRHLQFARGHRAIDELIYRGIGSLLTHGAKSAVFDSSLLRVMTKHIVRGGTRGLTLEDRLSRLIRALDGICKMDGVSGQRSVTELLSQKETAAIRRIVKAATREANRLGNEADRQGNKATAKLYRDVAQRIANSTTIQRGFRADLSALIGKHDLADPDVVSKFYQEHPRADGRDWLALISYYRGLVFHNGYIDFDLHPDAWEDASIILDHLHDLLLRMILKRLDYPSKYQPPVIKMTADFDLDWVTADTPPRRLGYE